MDVKELVEVTLVTLTTQKVLGPSLELVGQGIADRGKKNVLTIVEKAWRRLKSAGAGDEPGAVPPRVVGALLTDGQFCEDELTAEYFGGILAASRTKRERDDRGASLMGLLRRLSTYQIRAHYVFYRMFRDTFRGTEARLGTSVERNKLALFVPFEVFNGAMAFTEEERTKVLSILDNVLFGLGREGLIESNFEWHGKAEMLPKVGDSEHGGIILRPSVLGAELYLWGHGEGEMGRDRLFSAEVDFTMDQSITIPAGARKAEPPPKETSGSPA